MAIIYCVCREGVCVRCLQPCTEEQRECVQIPPIPANPGTPNQLDKSDKVIKPRRYTRPKKQAAIRRCCQ